MNNWLDYLLNLQDGKNEGICPYCGSKNLGAGFIVVKPDSRLGHGSIWCNDCKNAYHLSRMKVAENLPIVEELPTGLKY